MYDLTGVVNSTIHFIFRAKECIRNDSPESCAIGPLILQGIEFRNGDFRKTTKDAQAGDFIYLDPPYAGNRQRYIDDLDIDRFHDVLEEWNRRNIKWALSFDGSRGKTAYDYSIPAELYKRRELLNSGYSAVAKVLNGPVEMVTESLYINY